METIASSGASRGDNTKKATEEAVGAATNGLKGRRATYGFLFAGPAHDLKLALTIARRMSDGAQIIGCTTAGELTEKGLLHGGIAVLLIASRGGAASAYSAGLRANPGGVASTLQAGVAEARRAAAGAGHRQQTTVVLTDGLAGTGERLVDALHERNSGGAQIVGGAAGDEGRFSATHVGAGEQASDDAAAALHVFEHAPWGIGVNHGLRPTTKQMRVTKANGNVVHEIDGKPAFEAYKRHAAERGVTLTRENASPYLIGNELGIHFFEKIARARAPLSVGADGSLTCAAEIPKGSLVSILDGEPNCMIDAARSAAEEARERLGSNGAAGVLLFDCVCRGMILKDQFAREIEAVRSVFGDIPIAGFLTYGEIAKYAGRLDGWHNATAVVAAVPS